MRLIRVAIALCVCVGLAPAIAQAQDEAFKQGLQARGDRKWTDVARFMRAAVQSDPNESNRKVRSGLERLIGQGTEYLPHYFLGEALKNQGDCSGAVTEWALSEQQKIVQTKTDYWATLQKGYKECAAKGVLLPPEYNAQLTSSRQAYVDASALAKRIVDLGSAHKDLWPPFAQQYDRAHGELETASVRLQAGMKTRAASDFAEVKSASERAVAVLRPLEDSLNKSIETSVSIGIQIQGLSDAIVSADALDKSIDALKVPLTEPIGATRKSGRDQLAQARDRLATAQKTRNAATITDGTKLVQTATGAFNQVIEQLKKITADTINQRVSEGVRAADEAFASVSALMETLNRRASQKADKLTPEMTSQRDALVKQVETQRRRYEQVRNRKDADGLADVTKQTLAAQSALDTLIQAFGPLTLRERGVHAALEEGARLFFDGQYDKALTALDPSSGVGDGSLQLQVHLFRAASLFGLFVRSGETRKELLTQAVAEIETCKQNSSTFEPDRRVFAPRFITLYKTGGAAASQTTATQQ